MDVIPYSAPEIDPSVVQDLSAVGLLPAPMPFSFGTFEAALHVQPASSELGGEFENYLVSAVLGSVPFDFEVNGEALARFVESRLPGAMFHESTADYRALLLDFVLHQETTKLLGKDIGKFTITGVTRGRPSDRSVLCLITVVSGTIEIPLRVSGSEPTRAAFQRLCKAAPKAEAAALAGALEVVIVAGTTDLTLGELRQIRDGQGVLFDTTLLNQGRVVARVGNRPIATCTVSPGRAIVERAFEEAGVALLSSWKRDADESENMTDDLTEDTSMNGIKVRLNFELGRTEVSLADLQKLTPGHVFALPARPDEAIDVTIGGRVVARGAIVQIGPQLGVRITRMGL